ncbi:MAG: hypothetical protein GY719_31170 [bacterium]|nr:hypothetical protein [bacterium]
MTSRGTNSPVDGISALLELTASGRPQLLDFQLDVLLNSPLRYSLQHLAVALDVPAEKLGPVIYRASLDLDALERRRGVWRDPGEILDSPNVPALLHLCCARAGRIDSGHRRRRLEVIERRLKAAHELARSRAWIEEFIGEPLSVRQEARGC